MFDKYETLLDCAKRSADLGWSNIDRKNSSVLLGDKHGRRVIVQCEMVGKFIRNRGIGAEAYMYVARCRELATAGGTRYALGAHDDSRLMAAVSAVRLYMRGEVEQDNMIG